LFRRYFAGGITKQEIMKIYDNASDTRKAAIRAHARGVGLGLTVLSLIAILEDDDDPDTATIKTLKKFSNDIFVTTDIRRFVDYTIVPASIGTAKNASKAVMQAVSGEKTQRRSEYADRGESKALKTFMTEVSPLSEFKKQIARLGEE
jgi:lipopolysaccharide biosynthesis regulator YciM